MSQRPKDPIGVANLVLISLLLVGLVATNLMPDSIPAASPEQIIQTPLPGGGFIETERWANEPMDSWRDRHLAALKGFSQ